MNIQIEKPRLGMPACLIVDDPAPCINPFYYYRLQVDREGWERHEQHIPLDFLAQFAEVAERRGMRGKFSVLPYPAGLGSILEGWDGCDREELAAWLDLARTRIAPRFDITPEIMTHTRALDLATHALLPESEHDWMAGRTRAELKEYFGAALAILKDAGFAPNGITQPVAFAGSRADYAAATLDAIREVGGPPVTYYFIDGFFDPPPIPEPEVVLIDREHGEGVVSIVAYANDYFWPTQRVTSQRAEQVMDGLITADGRGGRLGELAEANAWLIFVCHWQTLYSDGSRAGLAALDEAAVRLGRTLGSRLLWLTTSEIARYRAASEACSLNLVRSKNGWTIQLDTSIACPDFTFSVQLAEIEHVTWLDEAGHEHVLRASSNGDELLPANSWRQWGEHASVCFNMPRGRQMLRLACREV